MRRSARPFGLYKQPRSQFWWARIRGERVSTKCTDYNEAVREAARLDADASATSDRPAYQAATFRAAIDRFLEAKRAQGRAAGTFDMYGKKIRHLVRFIPEADDVNTVTSELVDKMINTRRDEGASDSEIFKGLVTLRGILRQAKRDKRFVADLGEVMPIAFGDGYVPRTHFVSPSELDRILAQLPPNHAAATAFLAAAACRRGDMFRAEASDLKIAQGFIRVRATKTKRNREGFRLVPVTAATAELMKQIRAATVDRKRFLFDKWTNIGRDLANACERASACASCQATRERRRSEACSACEQIQPIAKTTPNDLRRTHAKWLRAHGIEYGLIGDVLGHIDGRMAKKVYGQTEPEMLAALLRERITPARVRDMARAKKASLGG